MGKSLKKQKKLWKYQVVTTTNSSSSLPSSSELCSLCSLSTGVQEAQLLNVLVLPYSCAHKYLAQLVEHISTQRSPLVCFSKRDLPTGSETWPWHCYDSFPRCWCHGWFRYLPWWIRLREELRLNEKHSKERLLHYPTMPSCWLR